MYSIDKEEAAPKTVVDVVPLGKWKRILVFLADFFLTFVVAFVLLNAMIMPIAQSATSFEGRMKKYDDSLSLSHTILYKNKVVLSYSGNDDNDINANILYTYNCWLSYYISDSEESPDPDYGQYGHKIDNKVIYHYFVDIRANEQNYKNLFSHYNESNTYFEYGSGDYQLKDTVKTTLSSYFNPMVTPGGEQKTIVNNIKSNVFLPLLAEVFTDIEKNDLTYNDSSYNKCQAIIDNHTTYLKNLLTITIFIAYGLAVIIMHLVIPLINKNRKTVSMMMMRVERIHISRLYICKRKESIWNFFYSLFTNAGFIIILPISFVNFAYVFNLNILVIFALLSLVLSLTSLIFILFNSYNRALSDVFSRSVLITTAKLDEIYRARGYKI